MPAEQVTLAEKATGISDYIRNRWNPANPAPLGIAETLDALVAELLAAQERINQTDADCVEYIDRLQAAQERETFYREAHLLLAADMREALKREKALREAIRRHRDEKWRDNGFRYDDWDGQLYREAGVHPMYPALAGSPSEKPEQRPTVAELQQIIRDYRCWKCGEVIPLIAASPSEKPGSEKWTAPSDGEYEIRLGMDSDAD